MIRKGLFANMPKHKVVEMNLSTGLRIGHIIAQSKFKQPTEGTNALEYLDNGFLLQFNDKGDLQLASRESEGVDKSYLAPTFLHYSEEHVTFYDNYSLDMFTVTYDEEGVAYPRGVALYAGDTFTTNNYGDSLQTSLDAGETIELSVENGVLVAAATSAATIALGKASTLPSGEKAMEVLWIGGVL